jgi:hypothetical protein
MPRDDNIHSSNWGGTGRGQGRKPKWYGKTVTMRIPADWEVKIKYCMAHKITPLFETVQNQKDELKNLEFTPLPKKAGKKEQ